MYVNQVLSGSCGIAGRAMKRQATACCSIWPSTVENTIFNLLYVKINCVLFSRCRNVSKDEWYVRPGEQGMIVLSFSTRMKDCQMKLPTARRFRINKWRWFPTLHVAKF